MPLTFKVYQCLIRIWDNALSHLKKLIWLATTCWPDQIRRKNCGIMTFPFIITAARTETDIHDWLPPENWSSDETLHLGRGKQVLGLCQAKAFHPPAPVALDHVIPLRFMRGEGETQSLLLEMGHCKERHERFRRRESKSAKCSSVIKSSLWMKEALCSGSQAPLPPLTSL